MKLIRLVPAIALVVAACGGGDAPDAPPAEPAPAPAPAPAGPAAPTGAMTIPDWYAVDHDARTVAIELTAGATADNNYWNFNGYTNGDLAITVPEGYTVEITLTNQDPNMGHSVGISRELSSFTMVSPDPVFAGAVTENPQSMVESTMPGETETISFVADAAGNYSMVCYIAGHSAVGMWLFFNVSGDGEAGVQGL